MDLDDLSVISDEEQSTEGELDMVKRSDTDEEDTDFPISISKTSTQSSDQRLQKYEETGHNVDVTKESRNTVQNESTIVREDRSSVGTTSISSANIISLKVENEILKTSESMLSFTSTEATCGSSSSDIISSEGELFDDFKDISQKCESGDVSCSEQPILALPRTAVENIPNSPSTNSFSGFELDKEFQTRDCSFTGAEGSSLQEESYSLKLQDIYNRLNMPSSPKGRLSNNFHATQFPSKIHFSSAIASDGSSNIQKLSAFEKSMIVSPLRGKSPSKNRRGDEKTEISDCHETSAFHDNDYNQQKEDKSVRRKVKTEYPASYKTNSLPTRSSEPSVSSSSREVALSLLQISESLELASLFREDDWVIYDTHGRSSEVKGSSPNPWVKELISVCQQIGNADTIQRLDTEGLLEEVHNFFQENRVDADENLSWKERKYRILTSKYFNDEFCRRHGLLSNEELVKEWLMDLESYTSQYQRNKLIELCRTLMECSVSEQVFIDYFKRVRDGGCDIYSINGPSNREHREDYVIRQLFTIEKDIDFCVMLELYKKLTREGASFLSILGESKEPSAAEEGFECRELLNTSENLNLAGNEFFAGDRCTIYADYLTINRALLQRELGNIDCPSSNEANMPRSDESATGSCQTDPRVSKETWNVPSANDSNALDSSVMPENETCYGETSMYESFSGLPQRDSRESKETSNVSSANDSNESVTGSSQTDSKNSKETSNAASVSESNSSVTSEIEPCNGETNMPHRVESATGSLQTAASKKSRKTSNVVSVSESNAVDSFVTLEDESCHRMTPLIASRSLEMLESSNDQSAGKDASNFSAADLKSK